MPVDALSWLRDPEEEKPDALRWLRDPAPAGGGAWEATASPNLQRRRNPDGSWEYRPTPREGQEPAVTPATKPEPSLALGAGQVWDRAKQGAASLFLDIPGAAVEGIANAPAKAYNAFTEPIREHGVSALPTAAPPPEDPLVAWRERTQEAYDRRRDETAEMFREAPGFAAVADTTLDLVSDPTNLLPSAGGARVLARRGLSEMQQRAAELAAVRGIPVEEALKVVGMEQEASRLALTSGRPYQSPEELAALAAREEGLARLRSEDLVRTLPEQPPPRRLGAGVPDDQIEQALGMRASPEEGAELARLSLPIGESDARVAAEINGLNQRLAALDKGIAEMEPNLARLAERIRAAQREPASLGPGYDADDALAWLRDPPAEGSAVTPPPERAAPLGSSVSPPETAPGPRILMRDIYGDPSLLAETPGPLTLEGWHGTTGEFDTARPGTFFSSDRRVAESFARSRELEVGGSARVFSAPLRFDNPLVIDGAGRPAADFQFGKTGEAVQAALREGAYDGLVLRNVNDGAPSAGLELPRSSDLYIPTGETPLSAGPKPPGLRMSTKGIENVAGLQDDLRRVVDENRPEIEAARGPAVPVSRWHDAPALQAKLQLFPEDYLAMPPGRTLNPDEGALGKHYLGQMKRQAKEVEARIASGEVDDMAAAVAEKNARNRDVVKMMAVLQGQGSSEAGRYMRMLQEALDPQGLADTPRERLQLALLKKYKEANVQTAQRIEQQAVARLQKAAAREARKAQRAATAEELSAELGDLAKQFGDLSRRPRGAAGGIVPIDPDLVEVVGKMAANRVRAGVVAVEELADQVYTAVRMYADDVTREQVKAAIVEHALARPKKKERVRLAPEQRRLQQAEAAAGRAVKALEKRIAAGGAPPTGQASPWSAKLAELKAKQAQLRDQLAAMQPPKPAPDPAARKLRSRETALARQVEKAEKQLAAGPQIPKAAAPAPDSPRIQELRQQLAEVRAQLAADPRQALTQRYRELLDDQTVEMIAALPDPTEDPAALLNFLRQMERPTFRDFRTTFWINSILSGTRTAGKNLGGNVVRLAELTAMRAPGVAYEVGLARLQGREAQRSFREVLPATMGAFRGIPEGLRKFAFVMKEGYDPGRIVAELTEGGANKYDMPLPVNPFLLSENRAVRAVGVPLTLPTRLLEATDALFKVMASTSEMYAGAARTAAREGLAGDALAARVADLIANPTDEMVEAAHRFALRATYQDPASWIGDLVSSARRGVPGSDELAERLRSRGGVGNRLVAATVQAPQTVMQHLVPFIHISDRVAASITDYIPLSKPGKLAAAFIPDDVWSGLPAAVERNYRFQPGEAADFLARQTVGATLGMLGITWAAQGKLVGQAPKDEKLRNDFYAEGKQPYSLLIGNRWVPMRDALGPLAGPFVAASMYQDHVRAGEDPSAAITGMALGSARYMLEASYLATLQQVVEAVEGERGDVGAGVSKATARVAAGYNPYSGFQRGVAQAMDTSTNILGQTGPRVVQREGFVDELKSGIPGLRQDLPSRVGTLGEELVQATGRAGAFLPVVPTENRVSLPKQAERIEVLRATLAKKRTELRRVEEAMANAEKLGDTTRLAKLRTRIPEGVNAAMLDGTFERIRAEEQELRLVRSDRSLSREARRQAEAEILERIRMDLEYDLRQVGVSVR